MWWVALATPLRRHNPTKISKHFALLRTVRAEPEGANIEHHPPPFILPIVVVPRNSINDYLYTKLTNISCPVVFFLFHFPQTSEILTRSDTVLQEGEHHLLGSGLGTTTPLPVPCRPGRKQCFATGPSEPAPCRHPLHSLATNTLGAQSETSRSR